MFVAGSSIAAAISGPVSGPLLSLDGAGGITGWQWLFGIEGMLSVVVGCVAYRLLDSMIKDARWLSGAEQRALADSVEREDEARRREAGAGAGTTSRWKLLLNPQVLVFCGIYPPPPVRRPDGPGPDTPQPPPVPGPATPSLLPRPVPPTQGLP